MSSRHHLYGVQDLVSHRLTVINRQFVTNTVDTHKNMHNTTVDVGGGRACGVFRGQVDGGMFTGTQPVGRRPPCQGGSSSCEEDEYLIVVVFRRVSTIVCGVWVTINRQDAGVYVILWTGE